MIACAVKPQFQDLLSLPSVPYLMSNLCILSQVMSHHPFDFVYFLAFLFNSMTTFLFTEFFFILQSFQYFCSFCMISFLLTVSSPFFSFNMFILKSLSYFLLCLVLCKLFANNIFFFCVSLFSIVSESPGMKSFYKVLYLYFVIHMVCLNSKHFSKLIFDLEFVQFIHDL